VKPYLLLGTSYDGTMATVAKFTAIRVVCNNTITAAVGGYSGGRPTRGESEINTGYLKSAVRVLHSEKFDAEAVRLQLGIVANAWEGFLVQSRQLAGASMDQDQADAFVAELLRPYHSSARPVTESKAYVRIMQLFNGAAIGSDLAGVAGTRWAMLNAVTELVDHERIEVPLWGLLEQLHSRLEIDHDDGLARVDRLFAAGLTPAGHGHELGLEVSPFVDLARPGAGGHTQGRHDHHALYRAGLDQLVQGCEPHDGLAKPETRHQERLVVLEQASDGFLLL
jgi:hypothetical protein